MVPKTLDPSSVRRRGQARQHRDHREVHPIHEVGVHEEDSRASAVGCDAPGDRILRDVVHRASSSHGVGWTNPTGRVPGLGACQRSPAIRDACPLAAPKPLRQTRGPGQGPMWCALGAGAAARRGPEAPSCSRAQTRGLTSPGVEGDTTFCALPLATTEPSVHIRSYFGPSVERSDSSARSESAFDARDSGPKGRRKSVAHNTIGKRHDRSIEYWHTTSTFRARPRLRRRHPQWPSRIRKSVMPTAPSPSRSARHAPEHGPQLPRSMRKSTIPTVPSPSMSPTARTST